MVTAVMPAVTQEQHAVKDYVRDERVNRVMSAARVAKIRANLDLEGIGMFVVSERKNGELVILDGAHRCTALSEEGLGDMAIPALVHHNLSMAQEAQLFLVYNDRLAVDILERFRIQVAAKDAEAIVLDREIRAAGFVADKFSRNKIMAIKTLQTLYRGGSSTGREAHLKTLRDTLEIIKDAWGTEGTANKQTINGIGSFLLNHGEEIDQAHLVDALTLTRGGANAIVVRTHYHTTEGGKKAMAGAELAVAEIYNKGLKAAEKVKVG